mgnify:FL=1
MEEYKSIEDQAADCRAAFAGSSVGDPVWCCHHERHAERLGGRERRSMV